MIKFMVYYNSKVDGDEVGSQVTSPVWKDKGSSPFKIFL